MTRCLFVGVSILVLAAGCASSPSTVYEYERVSAESEVTHEVDVVESTSYVVSEQEIRDDKTMVIRPKTVVKKQPVTASFWEMAYRKEKVGGSYETVEWVFYGFDGTATEPQFSSSEGFRGEGVAGSITTLPEEDDCLLPGTEECEYVRIGGVTGDKEEIATYDELITMITSMCVNGKDFLDCDKGEPYVEWGEVGDFELKTPKNVDASVKTTDISTRIVLELTDKNMTFTRSNSAISIPERFEHLKEELLVEREVTIQVDGQPRGIDYYDWSELNTEVKSRMNEEVL